MAFLSFPYANAPMSKLATPRIRTRPHYGLNRSTTAASNPGLQGSAMPGSSGGTVANGTTYREVVATAGCDAIRLRFLTVGATGTLNIKPIRPQGLSATDESVVAGDGTVDPTKVSPYATGIGTVAVVAATEVKLDLALFGESYCLIEFVCTANGSITWADICTLLHTS